jgi:SanA protein
MPKNLKKIIFFGFIFSVLFTLGSNWLISSYRNNCYSEVGLVPNKKVGLVLGTIKYLKNGQINLYYQYRINAAVELYKAGKIKYVLISGDNSTKSYDEPSTFKDDLVAKGIPAEKIYLDYAGFRTLDSIVRANKVFLEDDFIIISQGFHNERALFIAEHKNIKACAFNAKNVTAKYGFKTTLREKLARVKAVLDIITFTKPKFLGETIPVQ